MKFIYAVLAALPAVMAAPAPAPAPDVATGPGTSYNTWACSCVNAAGDTAVPSACLYYAGGMELDGENYCWPGGSWTLDMPTPFDDALCTKLATDGSHSVPDGHTKAVCKNIKVCWSTGDYFQPCK